MGTKRGAGPQTMVEVRLTVICRVREDSLEEYARLFGPCIHQPEVIDWKIELVDRGSTTEHSSDGSPTDEG